MNIYSAKAYVAPDIQQQIQDLKLFNNYLYEYKKGIRNLVLATEKSIHKAVIESKLKKENISYAIQDVNKDKINVYFGAKQCIDVVKTFIDKKFSQLTPEQDFILGTMLGYDTKDQCTRYLDMCKKAKSKY